MEFNPFAFFASVVALFTLGVILKQATNLGSKLALGYLYLFFLLCLAAPIVALYLIIYTLPWSVPTMLLLQQLGYTYQPPGHNSMFFGTLGLLPAALINAAILYALGKFLTKEKSKKRSK